MDESKIQLSLRWYLIFGIFGVFRSLKTCYLQPYIELVNGIDDEIFRRFLLPLTTYTQTVCLIAVTLFVNKIGYKTMIFIDAFGQFASFSLIFFAKYMNAKWSFIANVFSQIIYGVSEATSICFHSYMFNLFDQKHHYALSAFTRSLAALGHSLASFGGFAAMGNFSVSPTKDANAQMMHRITILNRLVGFSLICLVVPVLVSLAFPARASSSENSEKKKGKFEFIRSSLIFSTGINIFYFSIVLCIHMMPPKIALLMMKEILMTNLNVEHVKNMFALMDGISRILCTVAGLYSVRLKVLSTKVLDAIRFSLLIVNIGLFLTLWLLKNIHFWIVFYVLMMISLTVLLTSLSNRLTVSVKNGQYAFVFGVATLVALLVQSGYYWVLNSFIKKSVSWFPFAVSAFVIVAVVAVVEHNFRRIQKDG
jgi:hypothetical protein